MKFAAFMIGVAGANGILMLLANNVGPGIAFLVLAYLMSKVYD